MTLATWKTAIGMVFLIVADPIRAGQRPLENLIDQCRLELPKGVASLVHRANQRDRLGSAKSARTAETVGHGPRRFAKLLASREENYGEEN
jgi:hypothetical protein